MEDSPAYEEEERFNTEVTERPSVARSASHNPYQLSGDGNRA